MVPNPSAHASSSEPAQAETVPANVTPYNLTLLNLPANEATAGAEDNPQPDATLLALGTYGAYRPSAQEQAEHSGVRPLPWPIDILLYPFSAAGLVTLGIVIVIPMLIDLVVGLAGPFGFFFLIPGTIVNAVLALYFLWYMTQCIADSALGGVRAPETVAQAPGLWEIITQMARTLACLAVALLPMMIYWLSGGRSEVTLWSLLVFAAALCPMALLAVTMFDSIAGLNPLVLIPSVLSTLVSYLGLVVVLGSMIFLIVNVEGVLAEYPLLGFAFGMAEYYLILIAAHLLGRFYWRQAEKLNWDV